MNITIEEVTVNPLTFAPEVVLRVVCGQEALLDVSSLSRSQATEIIGGQFIEALYKAYQQLPKAVK